MAKEPKNIKLSDGQEVIIHSCGGKQARRLVLQIVDLMKPEQLATQEQKEATKNFAKNLILNGSSDSSFLSKSEKLLDELFGLAYIKVESNFVELTPPVFDVQFAGRLAQMIELLIEIIEHNGFLDLLGYLKTATKMFQQ